MNPASQRQALRDAAHWHARLGAAPDCTKTYQQWQDWHQQSPLHQWAWHCLEALQVELRGVPATLAQRTLNTGVAQAGRRTLLKGLMLGLGVSGLAWAGYRSPPMWLADLHTVTGERRNLTLEDGTRLTLNTASAVDIRYGVEQRLIVLHAGEIMVDTAKDSRPLTVHSVHGAMQALGTCFSVRQQEDYTELNVFEHAVAVRNRPDADTLRVEAGMRLRFDRGPMPAPHPADPNQAQWLHGRLVIDNWRLDHTLNELQRYRAGFIDCADDIAHLRLSGVYPLEDTDRALAAIARALPVRFETRTRYWVRACPLT